MQIRPAQPADAQAVAEVHVRTWQTAYRGLVTEEYLAQLSPRAQAERYTFGDGDPLAIQTILACEAGAILGFASTSPSRDPGLNDCGELCALYVDPDHWNRGIGVALITAARTNLTTLGYSRAILCILAGNLRADRFYRADGWLPDGTQKTVQRPGATLHELRYTRTLVSVFPNK